MTSPFLQAIDITWRHILAVDFKRKRRLRRKPARRNRPRSEATKAVYARVVRR